MSQAAHIDMFGEMRAAVAATRRDPDQFGWVVFSLSMLDGDERRAGLEKVCRELEQGPHNGADLVEWADFASAGVHALAKRIEEEAPWVRNPRWTAAMWLGAWAWQCAIKDREPGESMHVCLGLGLRKLLVMQWDTSMTPAMWHVTIVEGNVLGAGVFNLHARLAGWPCLPAYVHNFGPGVPVVGVEVSSETQR